MPTIRDILADAIPRLTHAGVDTPKLDAELLLGHVLGRPRTWLWTHHDTGISDEDVAPFVALLRRREHREPIAYLLGEWEFYARPFTVTPAVLVPRPETELLVEAVLRWADTHPVRRIADIGTGSGIIAVTLALELPNAEIYAVDLSADALATARGNAARHGVGERITFFQGDLLAPLPTDLSLDIIVANLPYITDEDMAGLMPEVRDYEPEMALRGGADGLALVLRLITDSPVCLRPGGLLALEVGDGQAPAVADHLRTTGWSAVHTLDDYGGIQRDVLAEYR
jgi:release factor glutamine methyltransferase